MHNPSYEAYAMQITDPLQRQLTPLYWLTQSQVLCSRWWALDLPEDILPVLLIQTQDGTYQSLNYDWHRCGSGRYGRVGVHQMSQLYRLLEHRSEFKAWIDYGHSIHGLHWKLSSMYSTSSCVLPRQNQSHTRQDYLHGQPRRYLMHWSS